MVRWHARELPVKSDRPCEPNSPLGHPFVLVSVAHVLRRALMSKGYQMKDLNCSKNQDWIRFRVQEHDLKISNIMINSWPARWWDSAGKRAEPAGNRQLEKRR